MRTKNVLPAAALTLLSAAAIAPASASAACAKVPLKDLVSGSAVIATVQFVEGPASDYGELRTPAAANVLTYDQGRGPQQLKVTTALGALAFAGEGIRPRSGERWRVYGAVSPNGALGTSTCSGSVLMPAKPASAALTAGGTSRALVPASVAGKPHKGALPVVKLPRSGTVKLTAASPALDVAADQAVTARLIEPGRGARTLKVTWSGRSSAMTGRLPKLKLGKKGATLVIVTREAAFALALRRPA